MVVHIDIRQIELTVVEDNKDALVIIELAQIASVLLVVDAVDVWVEPYFPAAKGGMSVTLQTDALNRVLRQQVALAGAPLDTDLREVLDQEDVALLDGRIKGYLDALGLSVGVGGEIDDARTGLALRDVVLFLTCDGWHIEALDIVVTAFAVAIDCIVDGALVVLLEHLHMHDVLADKHFLADADDLVFSVFIENDDVVDVGTVANEFVFLQTGTDESFLTVDIELLVGFHHLRSLDGLEVPDFRQTRVVGTVFALDELKPANGDIRHAAQVLVDALDLVLDAGNEFVALVLAELRNALHLDFQQAQDVFLAHLADKLRIERGKPFVDVFAKGIAGGGVLKGFSFVDALLDEDALQGGKEQLFFQFGLAYLQFLAQQFLRALNRMLQHIAHRQEARLMVFDDTAVGRNVDFAVRERIQGIEGFVG